MMLGSSRYFPVIRFHAAIVSKRTARFKRNDLSCRDSCLRGCSIVPILPLMPPGQRFRPRFRAASTRAPLESSTFRSIAMVTHWVLLSRWPETLDSQEKHARIMPLRSIHLGNPGPRVRAVPPPLPPFDKGGSRGRDRLSFSYAVQRSRESVPVPGRHLWAPRRSSR